MPEEESSSINLHYHDMPCGGHATGDKTGNKILQVSFYWLTLFKDVHNYVWTCERCQRTENWLRRNEMPFNYTI